MNNLCKTSSDGNPSGTKRGFRRTLSLALAIVASACTAEAQISASSTGYMVEMHTANISDSGTDSVIKMSLAIRDRDWKQRSLGPWIVDHCGRNDHERNQWDNYFFPESTATSHIEKLWLESDGLGNGPGWNWDKLYVTRVENGRAVWSWAWEMKVPLGGIAGAISGATVDANPVWIYKGRYSFDFTYGGWGRAIPLNLQTPTGLEQEFSGWVNKGSILVTTTLVIPATQTCPDEFYRVNSTNVVKSVQKFETLLGNGQKQCTFITLFPDMTGGFQRIEKLDPYYGYVTASRDVIVSARQMANVSFTPPFTKVPTPVTAQPDVLVRVQTPVTTQP